MDYLVVGIASYLMGSVPFGLILTKIFLKKDIRKIGSGNIGATNALRTGNKLIGYSTLLLDIAKAIIPVIYVKINYLDLIYIASLCAFLGHVFPIWLKFKGGKGVAVYLGIIISLSLPLGIVFGVSWLFIALIFKYSSLSSMIGALIVLLYSILLNDYSLSFFLFKFYYFPGFILKLHIIIGRKNYYSAFNDGPSDI